MKKSILITGSTDGIGKLAAIKLAKEGHEVYLHGRNQQKLASAIADVKALSGNNDIKGFVADFADLAAVKQMAEQIKMELSKLDILINNAGVFKSELPLNKAGLDLRMVVNYLAPVLLTNELIPLLKKGTEPRLILLGSAAQSPVSLEVLTGIKIESERETYAQSKLALTMWGFDLAKALNDVSVIVVNPGSLLHTKMALEAFGNSWAPADKGADILFDLAVGEAHKGITGEYFDNDQGKYGHAHPDAYNELKIDSLVRATDSIFAIKK